MNTVSITKLEARKKELKDCIYDLMEDWAVNDDNLDREALTDLQYELQQIDFMLTMMNRSD